MLCGTLLKTGLVVGSVGLLAGGVAFGPELCSYATSSVRQVRSEVKESVPVTFELERARDLLDDIVPEMQANIRRIAEEEVALAQLKQDIEDSQDAIDGQRTQLARLRTMADGQVMQAGQSFVLQSQGQAQTLKVSQEMARRLDRVKEAEVVLAGKKKLLDSREQVLQAAIVRLEETKSQQAVLKDRIEALAAQDELVKAAAVGSAVALDNSKLAQTQKLLKDIQTRLDVSERVLARQAAFTDSMVLDEPAIDTRDVVAEVDAYLNETPSHLVQGEQAKQPLASNDPRAFDRGQ